MLPAWITRLVLTLALAVLPLQGLAQTVQLILCHPQNAATDSSAGVHGHPGHDHGAAEVGHAHHAGHDDGSDDSSGQHGSHFCCDFAGAVALPVFAKSFAALRFFPVAAMTETSRYSTYLKLPQRSPLA